MKELKLPLRDLMAEPLDEASMRRLRHRIGRKLEREASVGWMRSAAKGAAMAIPIACVIWGWNAGHAPAIVGEAQRTERLVIEPIDVPANDTAPRLIKLADGSTIEARPGTRLIPIESSETAVSLRLEEGRVELHVQKGGPRRWSIECGLATVEVAGTRFAVQRASSQVRVDVTEGVVLVRSANGTDRIEQQHVSTCTRLSGGHTECRLEAGHHVEISRALPPTASLARAPTAVAVTRTPAASSGKPPPEGAAAPEVPALLPTAEPASAPVITTATPTWREAAKLHDYKEAYRALGLGGIAQETPRASAVEQLWELADVARYSGHSAEAVEPLSRIIRDYPSEAGLAALSLGRLQLNSLGRPAQAAQSFTMALSRGLNPSLVEEARARLVEAHARAGNTAAVRSAAEAYEASFPGGKYLDEVRRWVGDGQ